MICIYMNDITENELCRLKTTPEPLMMSAEKMRNTNETSTIETKNLSKNESGSMQETKRKVCSKCKIEKELGDFYFDKGGKYERRSDCKECHIAHKVEYQKLNRDKVAMKNKKWALQNKEHIKQYRKEYGDRRRMLVKKRYNSDVKFRNARLQEVRDYRKHPKNKEAIRNTKKRCEARYKQNPIWRATKNLRRRLSFVLNGRRKYQSSFKLIGCSAEELKIHLEKQFRNGMSWDNYGLYGWHIDHIKPCSSFDLSTEEGQKQCFHYTNLQPLWAHENLAKGEKIL